MELEQVLTALRNADAAGNVEDARQLARIAQQLMAAQPPEEAPKPKTGIGAAIGKGVESLISSGRTALGAATGDAEAAARAGLERGEAMGKKYADQVSLQKVKDAYNKDGVLSAAGEALSQIPAALAEQAPNLAAMAGSARLGATAGSVLGPVGATVGGIGGALLPSLIQQFSGNVERQAQEGVPVNAGRALAAAVPQAGLDVAGSLIPFGGRLVQKLTGIPMGALLGRSAEGAAKLADERLLTVLAKGVGVGALAEIPTEITQQMLERAQAGLSLSSPDALREYGETAYQVGLLAPLGAVGRLSERGGARAQVEQKAQEEATKAAEVQQQQAAVAAQQKATDDADPNYAEKLRKDYVAANVEMQRLNDAVRALSAAKDPLSVADAKDARVARDAYAKETMQPLVNEIRRVRQLHPGVDFRPPAAVAPAVAAAEPTVAPVEPMAVQPAVAEPVVTTTPMPEATTAPLPKAQTVEGTVSAPVDEVTPPVPAVPPEVAETEVEPVKKPRAKKAVAEAPVVKAPVVKAPVVEAPVVEAPVVEDTTVEPTEPKTLEQAFATTQKPKEIPVGSQYMIPGAAQLNRTRAVQTQELTQEIRTELTQLSKNLTVARQEGRKGDALEIIARMRYLQDQGRAASVRPVWEGAAGTKESETIEKQPAERTSPRALQQDIERAQALPNLSDTNAKLLDKLQQNLPALLQYKAPTTGRIPGLETVPAVPEAARGAGDTRVRIVDFLDSLRQGLPAETEARNLQQQLAQIERQAQQEVSPRELQGMLAKVSKPKSSATATRDVYAAPLAERTQASYRKFKAPEKAALDNTAELSRNERGLLRLVGENQAAIMADPAARMTVARWLSSDVGQGIGDATQDLRKYFGVAEKAAPAAQEDMFPAEREQEVRREETRGMYEDLFSEQKPTVAETRAEKQKESSKERKLTGDLSALPGKQISFERRRAMLAAIDEAPLKRQAFEDAINDANLSQEERDVARTQLTTYLVKLRKRAENKDASYATAYRLRGEESQKTQDLKKKLEAPGLTDAKRKGLQTRFRKAQDQLNKRDEQLARLRGVEIEAVETPEQRSQTLDTLFRETYGQAVSEEQQVELNKTKGRALGAVARKEVFPATVFYSGEEGGVKETEKRTYTRPDMRLTETRGVKQRDVQISKAEMESSNKLQQQKKEAFDARAQEQQLFEIAQKKVEDLSAKLTNIKERVAAVGRLDPRTRKQTLVDSLNVEQTRITAELSAAKTDAAQAAPKTGTISQKSEGEIYGGEFEGKMRGTSGPNDTPLSAKNVDLLGGNKLAAVLTNISEKSSNHVARRIAGKLAAVVEVNGVNVKLVEVTAQDSPDAPGSTSRDGNRVRINENTGLSEETVVHEAAHAATMFELDKADDKLTPNQRKAKDELNRMRDSVLADKDFDNKVIKDGDIHEFVAEGLASRAVQTYMRGKQWEGRSLWQRFKDGLLRLIGVNTPAKGPMLDRFLDLAENFIAAKAENAPSVEKTKLRSVGSLLSPKDVKYANPGLAAAGVIGDTFIAKERGVIDRVRAASGGWLGAETQFVDRFAPLERVSKGMEALKGSQMMYYLRMYDQRMNFTAQSVANGAIQRVAKQRKDGRTEYVVESVDGANIQQVVDILKKAPAGSPDAANRLFTMYLAGIRAKNKGFQTLHFGDALTEAQLDSAMANIRATPGLEENFKQARDVYNEYNRNMVGFLEQSGAISKAHAARLTKENDYIPFYREQNGVALLTIGGETPIRVGSIAEQPYLHELVGGDRPILDFLTSSVQNTALITDMGLRNLATKNSMNELEDMGLAQIRRGPGTADPKVVRFKIDGDDYHAIVDTDKAGVPADLLVKGMQGIPTQFNVLVRALGFPATLLRRAVTLSPTYAARQLFRDSLAASLLSGADFVPVLGALKEINIFGKPSAAKSTLEKRGITGGQIFAGGSSSEAMTKILNDMMSGKGNLGQLISKAEALNMEADAATRRAQYNSYIKQGLSEMEATLMSLESMNFNKRGASPSIHMANALIPFFNSQIQGLNVLYKALTGKLPFDKRLKIQEKLITNGALMFGASLAYAAMMQDDEAYKNATPEQKYGNWFIRIPGIDEPIKAPIPFEVGYLFKALPEAIYNSLANENGAEEAFKALNAIILQTLPGGTSMATVQYKGVNIPITPPIPQALKPGIEAALGKSFYTRQDILSRREQAVLPEQQFRESSSEISKMMGSGLGLSPIKIEALVSGYTGTMGLALMQVLSMGVPTGESPEKTTKRLSDMPVIGSSFQPNDAGGIINAVYERMNDVKKVKTTVDRMLSEGRVAEAKELVSQRSEEFAQAGVADYFTSNMQQITKYENAIRASNLTGDEKQAKLAEMRQLKIRLAETVRQATDAAKNVDKTTRP